MAPLASLTCLRECDLSDCTKVSHINDLQHCAALAVIILSGCRSVTDISVLGKCQNLSELSIAGVTLVKFRV